MAKPNEALFSLVLASAIALCALLLGTWLWWERRTREEDLPAADQKHFFLQDLRRAFGILLMALLAVGVYFGSRLPWTSTEPKAAGAARAMNPAGGGALPPVPRLFLTVWLAVFAGIVILLGLALIDWVSTRRYARRLREAMNAERLDILRATLRRHDSERNGSAEDAEGEPL